MMHPKNSFNLCGTVSHYWDTVETCTDTRDKHCGSVSDASSASDFTSPMIFNLLLNIILYVIM